MGIPVSCEVDIYGALSEFIGTVVSNDAVTLLDINNTVPSDIYKTDIEGKFKYTDKDVFMGFHCGNTASGKLSFCEMKNQMIMARSLPEEVTNGTLEGDIMPGDITFFRLQSTADAKLNAYIAQGEVLPLRQDHLAQSGIFAIPERDVFTDMCLLRTISLIMAQLHSDISEKQFMKYLNIWELRKSDSISQRECFTEQKILFHNKYEVKSCII